MIISLRHISVLLLIFLGACATTGQVMRPGSVDAEENIQLRPRWLFGASDEVAEKVVQNLNKNLKDFAPEVIHAFPKAKSISVSVTHELGDESRQVTETALNNVFTRVWQDVFTLQNTRDEVDIRVFVTFLKPRSSLAAQTAIAVPMMPVCLTSLFVLCPTKETELIKLRFEFRTEAESLLGVEGLGGAYKVLSTGVLEDNAARADELMGDRGTKALTAAIADAVRNAKAKGYYR